MSRRALVTGASGFIGAEVVRALDSRGVRVTGASRRRPSDTCGASDWIESDLLSDDPSRLVQAARARTLVHVAWITTPGIYVQGAANEAWLNASLALAEAFLAAGGRRIVGIGTCFEYDVDANGPRTAYAAAKAACRLGLGQRAAAADAGFAWARVFYLLGGRDHPDRFAPMLARKLVAGHPATISSGQVERDFIDVRDCGEALAALAASDANGDFDIATGLSLTPRDLATRMAAQAGRPDLVVVDPALDRPGDPQRLVGNPTALVQATGVSPRFALEESIDQVLSACAGGR